MKGSAWRLLSNETAGDLSVVELEFAELLLEMILTLFIYLFVCLFVCLFILFF